MARRLALCGALALTLLAAGCGSSKKSSSSSATTKAQYVARAEAICRAVGQKTGPLIAKLESAGPSLLSGGAQSARELAPVVEDLHADAASSLSELRALKRPKGLDEGVESFLSPLSNVVGAAAQAASSLSSGQGSAAIGLLAQVQAEAQRATKAADAVGLAPCGGVLAALG